jgi:hypothetical protein
MAIWFRPPERSDPASYFDDARSGRLFFSGLNDFTCESPSFLFSLIFKVWHHRMKTSFLFSLMKKETKKSRKTRSLRAFFLAIPRGTQTNGTILINLARCKGYFDTWSGRLPSSGLNDKTCNDGCSSSPPLEPVPNFIGKAGGY